MVFIVTESTRCIDMALEFPHAEVLGIDIQLRPQENVPSNCSFRIHDINTGLSQFHGMYDLVHCRYSGQAVRCVVLHGFILTNFSLRIIMLAWWMLSSVSSLEVSSSL
jgi:hypothetical protein